MSESEFLRKFWGALAGILIAAICVGCIVNALWPKAPAEFMVGTIFGSFFVGAVLGKVLVS